MEALEAIENYNSSRVTDTEVWVIGIQKCKEVKYKEEIISTITTVNF